MSSADWNLLAKVADKIGKKADAKKYKGLAKKSGKGKGKGKKKQTSLSKAMNLFTKAGPFPMTKTYKLRYTENHILSAGISGIIGTTQTYSINDIYDTDLTGAGHQPYGHDTLATIYNRYKVIGCWVKLICNDPSQDGLCMSYEVHNPSNASATIAGQFPHTVAERQMGGLVRLNNSGSQKATKNFYVPMYKAAGCSKLQFDADPDNYTAAFGGSPGNQCRIEFGVADLRGGSSGSILCDMELTFVVFCYQRKILAKS